MSYKHNYRYDKEAVERGETCENCRSSEDWTSGFVCHSQITKKNGWPKAIKQNNTCDKWEECHAPSSDF